MSVYVGQRYLTRGVGILTRDEASKSLVNSDRECEIALSYMDRLMMDFFLPLFQVFFLAEHKVPKKREKLNFLLIGFTLFLSSRVFLSGTMGVNTVAPRY